MNIKDLSGLQGSIYLRKSRAEELSDTTDDVLKRHKETLLGFAIKYNLIVNEEDVFEEVVSGESIFMRPEMCKLLECVESQKYKFTLIIDIDRLGRGGMKDQGIILETYKEAGTAIVTPRRVYDLSNEQDEDETENEAFFARKELKKIKRRLNDGKIKTTEEGGHLANPPFGYKRAWVNKIPTLEIILEEANFVRMIFDMYVNQGIGGTVIADTLTSLGAKPHRNGPWSRNTVRTILQNPIYIGKIVRNKKKIIRRGQNGSSKNTYKQNPRESWMVIDGIHEPIIDEDIFNKALEIRAGRYHPSYRKEDTLENPLAGLIVCKQCGFNLQRRKFKKKTSPHWFLCTTKQCVKATRFDRVETALLEALQLELDRFKFIRETCNTNEVEIMAESIKYIESELVKNEKQMDKLHDLLEQEVYTIEIFMSRSTALTDKIESLRKSLIEMKNKALKLDKQKYAYVIDKFENVLSTYSYMDNMGKNNLLKSIIEKAVYYKEKEWVPDQFELVLYVKNLGMNNLI